MDGTKIAPPGDLFDQPSVEMHSIWGKLANHIGDNVVLSPEEVILLIFPVTESLYPRPPQSLKHSKAWEYSRRDCVHKTVRVRPCADCVATLEKLHAVWAGGLEAPRGKRFKKKTSPRWYTGQFIGSANWKAPLWGNVVGQEASFQEKGVWQSAVQNTRTRPDKIELLEAMVVCFSCGRVEGEALCVERRYPDYWEGRRDADIQSIDTQCSQST